MKKIILTIAAVSALFVGCNKNDINETEGKGTVSLSLSVDENLNTKAFTLPQADPNTFNIVIESTDGSVKKEYNGANNVPSVIELPSGEYTAKVNSPNTKKVSWDQPIFGGEKKFAIVVGKASMVEVQCALTNMVVTVNPTQSFLNEVPEFEVTVTSTDSTLVWDKAAVEAGKAGYFSVSQLDVYVKGTRHNGQEIAQIHRRISDCNAKDHHIVNIDAKVTGTLGGLNITIDPTVVDKNENVHIPGIDFQPIPDEPEGGDPVVPAPSTAPTLTWAENPNFDTFPLAETMNVELTVEAKETIKSFIVKVESPSTAFLGILTTMIDPKNDHSSEGYVNLDLIDDQTAVTNLSDPELGLPVGELLSGKTSVPFSLSKLLPMILGFGPEQGSIHTFTMNVTDAKGQNLTQALPFQVQ